MFLFEKEFDKQVFSLQMKDGLDLLEHLNVFNMLNAHLSNW